MIILDYDRKQHRQIIQACVKALRQGKLVVYPTDTSYGLACDITNSKAVAKLYKIKQRTPHQPIHVVVPSIAYAKSIAAWNLAAAKLAKKFWPGPLTLVLPSVRHTMELVNKSIRRLAASGPTIGLRLPDNQIALDLAAALGEPIPATGANPLGRGDCYSLSEVLAAFEGQKTKPDIIINTGRLPKRRPSTLVKIDGSAITILRRGPITEKQIGQTVNTNISSPKPK